ncbi:MAG: hypothetical protein J3R72DRAFT_443268 [Linnemannia gamsii]|nr:MAG: hypothetical protein J3R72DRAFT_443268 [Linnemannia gamsii]
MSAFLVLKGSVVVIFIFFFSFFKQHSTLNFSPVQLTRPHPTSTYTHTYASCRTSSPPSPTSESTPHQHKHRHKTRTRQEHPNQPAVAKRTGIFTPPAFVKSRTRARPQMSSSFTKWSSSVPALQNTEQESERFCLYNPHSLSSASPASTYPVNNNTLTSHSKQTTSIHNNINNITYACKYSQQ